MKVDNINGNSVDQLSNSFRYFWVLLNKSSRLDVIIQVDEAVLNINFSFIYLDVVRISWNLNVLQRYLVLGDATICAGQSDVGQNTQQSKLNTRTTGYQTVDITLSLENLL